MVGCVVATHAHAESRSAASPQDSADALLTLADRIHWNRRFSPGSPQDDPWAVALQLRSRTESVSNTWRRGQAAGTNTQHATQLGLRLEYTGPQLAALVEIQDARVAGVGPGDFDARTENQLDLLQALVRWRAAHWRWGLLHDPALHVGRMTHDVGRSRLVGRNLFPNTTNTFDGAAITTRFAESGSLRLYWHRAVELRNTARDRSSSDLSISGGVITWRQAAWEWEAAIYDLQDQRSADPSAQRDIQTYSLRALTPGSGCSDSGCWQGETELAVQHGQRFGRDHQAHLFVAKLGYSWRRSWQPFVGMEYLRASGTDNPDDGHSQTFDRLFGLRVLDLGLNGLYGPVGHSNLETFGWRVQVQPRGDTQLSLRHHANWLDEARDIFDLSGSNSAPLQDPTGSAGRWLGQDVQLLVNHQISPHLSISSGLIYWWKGDYFDRLAALPERGGLPLGGEDDSRYVFLQLLLRL